MKKVKKINKFLINFIIMFASVFTTLIVIFSVISLFIYDNFNFSFDLLLMFVTSVISSIVLMALFKIKKISVVLQAILVYTFLSITIVLLGYFLFIYDFVYNFKFLIATLIMLFIGGLILGLTYFVSTKKEDTSLNDHLRHFKERDN